MKCPPSLIQMMLAQIFVIPEVWQISSCLSDIRNSQEFWFSAHSNSDQLIEGFPGYFPEDCSNLGIFFQDWRFKYPIYEIWRSEDGIILNLKIPNMHFCARSPNQYCVNFFFLRWLFDPENIEVVTLYSNVLYCNDPLDMAGICTALRLT